MTILSMVRTPKLEGDKVKINSTASEELSINEFKGQYQSRLMEIHGYEQQIAALNAELDKFPEIAVDEELKKFKELLDQANDLVKIDEAKNKIKELDKKLVKAKDEIKSFQEVVQKIQNK